ncbi:MAG: hypothetical protein IPJ11_08770 [Gemmatimonadetes bacterium]|nr:hypothetical protein [Gemmatimonadota bacterium]
MIIDRHVLIRRLVAFAKSGHGLVTGVPGVGKSYSLASLHDALEDDGTNHAIIAVERLGSVTDAEIKSVLGIDTDLVAYFGSKFVSGGGVVVFDGFDAVRNDAGRERLLSLIRRAVEESQGRWTVIVSVRQFDAERSQGLRDLFRDPSTSRPYKGIGIEDARVLRIPKLTDEEVESGIAQVEGLAEVLVGAAPELRELLRIPFNLWLIERILGTGGEREHLGAIASEVQLLGFYWKRRVLSGDRSDQARTVLARVVREMIASRSMTVRRDEVFEFGAGPAWNELLGAEVLVESGSARQRIAFSHNILFDYAVSVLALDDEPAAITSFIAEDASRPFFLRPSLTYYYTRLWFEARAQFWASSWATHASPVAHVGLVGRLMPSAVIVHELRTVGDLQPVFSRIDKGDLGAADFGLRILQALGAIGSARTELWAAAFAEFAIRPRREYAWNLAKAAFELFAAAEPGPPAQLQAALGETGRRLLRWALDTGAGKSDRYADSIGALWALPLVAKTFTSNAIESEALLRRVLGLVTVPGFNIQYLTRLCDTVADLAPSAPDLLGEVYRVVFGHKERSEEETHFGSPILPLRSTRRQDFGMCEYALDKDFAFFLDASPVGAARAGLDAFNEYVFASHIRPYLREGKSEGDLSHTFEFRGMKCDFIQDFSTIWLDSGYPDYAVNVVAKLTAHLEAVAAAGNIKLVEDLLDVFAVHARTQAAWVMLFRSGRAQARELAPRLVEIAESRDVIVEAYHEVATFVAETFDYWTVDQQDHFEVVVEALLAPSGEVQASAKEPIDRLVMAIPSALSRSEAIQSRRQLLIERDAVPENRPPYALETSWREFTNEDWLKDQGVDTEAPGNRLLIDAAERLQGLTNQWQNRRPDGPAADALAEAMQDALHLTQNLLAGTPDSLLRVLSTRLSACAGVVARANDGVAEGSLRLARRVLLDAAAGSTESGVDDGGGTFDSPAWSPSPLTEAAQGLPWLVTRGDDTDVTAAIERLSKSSEPAVRYLIARELYRLRWSAEAAFWQIAGRLAESEGSSGVLAGLMHTLGSIKRSDAERIAKLLQTLASRDIAINESRSQYSEAYARLLSWLAFNVEERWGIKTAEGIADNPLQSPEITKRFAFEAMSIVTPEYLEHERIGPMSHRAVAWTRRLLAGVAKALPSVEGDSSGDGVRTLYGIVDDVASRLYFGTRRGQQDEHRAPTELASYLSVVRPVIDDIIRFGTQKGAVLVAHTAHHLMELLHACLPLDPAGILHLAAEVAIASKSAGYNLDQMAVTEVVGIANSLLTDYREVIAGGMAWRTSSGSWIPC